MIKKLRRRYIITNMALLSSTLIFALAILFGIIYRAEVQASYETMEQLMQDSSLPEPREKQAEVMPEAETGTAGVMLLHEPWLPEQPAGTTRPAEETQPAETTQPEWNGDWNQWYASMPYYSYPPYWIDPNNPNNYWNGGDQNNGQYNGGQGHNDHGPSEEEKPAETDNQQGQEENPQWDMQYPWWNFNPWFGWTPPWNGDGGYPMPDWNNGDWNQWQNNPEQWQTTGPREDGEHASKSTGKTTATEAARTDRKTETGTSDVTTDVTEQTTEAQSTETTEETTVKTTAKTAATKKTETEAAAAVEQDGSDDPPEPDAEPDPAPQIRIGGGHYVPDAYVARVDENGNIESYAGNRVEESAKELQAVNSAMDAVKKKGADTGTVKINDDSYRYLYQPDEKGQYHLVLLNRSVELSTVSKLVFIFLLITMIGLLCMFGISVLLANWSVKPIAAAWEKQKQFVADASHELKTPLAVISANTEVIMSDPQQLVSGQKKWLNYIQSETMRMSKLITNLLSVAKLDADETKNRTAQISVSETVSNLCLVFEPIIYEHNKTLNTVIQRNVYMRTDLDNLKQLLSILLDNAVQHSVPKAQITVSLSKDAQGKIRIAVSNTAKPIPPEQLAHLFDRFYRADTENSPNGSGLGLSIAQSITKQMGGKLTVTSEENLVTFIALF